MVPMELSATMVVETIGGRCGQLSPLIMIIKMPMYQVSMLVLLVYNDLKFWRPVSPLPCRLW